MARRVNSFEVRIMFDQPTYRALCERAKRSHTTMSTVVRRAVVQSLAAANADATAAMIAAVLKRAVGKELGEIQRVAILAALDAAEAKALVRVHLAEFMDADDQEWVADQVREAQAFAARRLGEPKPLSPIDLLAELAYGDEPTEGAR